MMMAANQRPVFTVGEPQHYGDYGCDPQMDYFQKMLEAARKRTIGVGGRNRDRDRDFPSTHHFKLQKPKDAAGKKKKRARWWWWWKSAAGLRFWKWARATRATKEERTPVSGGKLGPLYLTESYGGSRMPCRRRTGGGLFRSSPLVAAEMEKVEMPYLSLRDAGASPSGAADSPVPGPPAMPVYFVT